MLLIASIAKSSC